MARLSSVPEPSSCCCTGPAPVRYRCDVIARTVLDVVSGTGGRLADLAMAGWEVTAVVVDCSDPRPLRILGATVVDLGRLPAGPDRIPQMLTVADDACGSDERVRREVRIALDAPRTEVAVWGRDGAVELDAEFVGAFSPTRHRISAAGRAFKTRALIAAGRPPAFGPTEPIWVAAPVNRHIHTCI